MCFSDSESKIFSQSICFNGSIGLLVFSPDLDFFFPSLTFQNSLKISHFWAALAII